MLISDTLLERYANEFVLLQMPNYGVDLQQYISNRTYFLRRLRKNDLPKKPVERNHEPNHS